MTAPYAPGFAPGQPQQPMYPAQPGIIYAQQPGFAPAPAPQYAPQYQPQQPQQPPQWPQQPPQMPPQLQGADLNARLSGPGIPPELQGRTVGEGLRYYGVMREEFRRIREAQQGQPQLQGQPQAPQQGWPQQPPQPPQGSAQPRMPQQGQPQAPVDPMQQYITDGLRAVLPEMLAPVIVPQQQRTIQETYTNVRSRYQDWPQYEADIMQSLQGAQPAQLSNPDVLEAAYFYAKGRAQSRPQQPQQGWPQQQPQQPMQGPPMPPQYQGWPQQPTPQYQGAPQTFVEGPTPPPPQSFGPNGQGNDPRDEVFARRFNVPVEVYRSWKMPQGQNSHLGALRAPQPTTPSQQGNGQPMQPQYAAPWQGGQPYQPQSFAPPAQYQQPMPPGYYQPSLTNGDGYGR